MAGDLRTLENALKKIRIDFPELLQEVYTPGPVIQNISNSERLQEEFEETYRMLSTGIEPLIEENIDPLKDSAIAYHSTHKEIEVAAKNMSESEAHLTSLLSHIKTRKIEEYIGELKGMQEKYERDVEASETKQALSVNVLSVKDVYTGRLTEIMNNLQYVSEKTVRSEIKYNTESSLWKIKREIEKRIEDTLRGRSSLSPMDFRVLTKVSGCALTAVYCSAEECMVRILNKTSNDLCNGMGRRETFRREDETQVLSKGLQKFTIDVSALLRNLQSILEEKNVPEENISSKYRYNPEIYKEITLNTQLRNRTQIALPLYEKIVTEKDIFNKIVEWIQKFFRRLIGRSEHTSGETINYSIEKISRSDTASLMYRELFQNKYGNVSRAEGLKTNSPVMNVYSVTSEESVLMIHGCALEISDVLRNVLAVVLPQHTEIAEKVKNTEISQCFRKNKETLLQFVREATEELSVGETSSFLAKYCKKIRNILESLNRLVSVPINGLEIEVEKTAEEVLTRVLSSIEDVFKTVARITEEAPNLRYCEDSLISEEIEKWNNPLNAECALGVSIFSSCSSKKFTAISEFMEVPEEILKLIKRLFTALESKSRRSPENQPSENQISLGQIEKRTTELSNRIFGSIVSHLLSLVKATVNELLLKGTILDKKLEHFLSLDSYLTTNARHIVLQYITTHLLLHIEKCKIYSKHSSFKQSVASLQQKLEKVEDKNTAVFKYLPLCIFYILPYLQKKDKLFARGLLILYERNNLITKKIVEQFEVVENS